MDDFTFSEKVNNENIDLSDKFEGWLFEWINAGFKRIRCVKPQASGTDNRIIIELSDNRTYELTQTEVEAFNNPDRLGFAIKSKLAANNIYVHKNRNGRWAIATGQEPKEWPEDMVIA